MRILIIQTNTYELLNPSPIGASLVASRLARDGHEIRFVDLMRERAPIEVAVEAARGFVPELVCYSIRNRDNMDPKRYVDPIPGIVAVVQGVRRVSPNVPTLLGGTARAGGVMFMMFAESLFDCVLEELGKPFRSEAIWRDAAALRRAGIAFGIMPTLGGPKARARPDQFKRRPGASHQPQFERGPREVEPSPRKPPSSTMAQAPMLVGPNGVCSGHNSARAAIQANRASPTRSPESKTGRHWLLPTSPSTRKSVKPSTVRFRSVVAKPNVGTRVGAMP